MWVEIIDNNGKCHSTAGRHLVDLIGCGSKEFQNSFFILIQICLFLRIIVLSQNAFHKNSNKKLDNLTYILQGIGNCKS